jgi:hypothetical protein
MPLAEKGMPGKGDSPCPRLSTTTREQYVVEFAVARETGIKSSEAPPQTDEVYSRAGSFSRK